MDSYAANLRNFPEAFYHCYIHISFRGNDLTMQSEKNRVGNKTQGVVDAVQTLYSM